jgi:hypothetical protein
MSLGLPLHSRQLATVRFKGGEADRFSPAISKVLFGKSHNLDFELAKVAFEVG